MDDTYKTGGNFTVGCVRPPRSCGYMTVDSPTHDTLYWIPADEDLAAVIIQPGEGSQSFNSLMKTAQDVKDFFVKNYPTAFGKEGPNEELAKKFLDLR